MNHFPSYHITAKSLLVILLLGVSTSLFGQFNASLKVVLTRLDNGDPIPGAKIRFFGGTIEGTYTTNLRGEVNVTSYVNFQYSWERISHVYVQGFYPPPTITGRTGECIMDILLTKSKPSEEVYFRLEPVSRNDLSLSSPTIIYPVDGSKVRAGGIVFKWSTVPNARFYHLQVADNPSFKYAFVNNQFANRSNFSEQKFTYSRGSIQRGRDYYWRIRVSDGNQWGDWSQIYKFITTY